MEVMEVMGHEPQFLISIFNLRRCLLSTSSVQEPRSAPSTCFLTGKFHHLPSTGKFQHHHADLANTDHGTTTH